MQHAKRHFYITIFYYYYFYIFVRLCLTKKTIFWNKKKLPKIDLKGFLKHIVKPKNQKKSNQIGPNDRPGFDLTELTRLGEPEN